MDQRRSPRFLTPFSALYSTGREEGTGTLLDISSGGAQMAEVSVCPPIGTKIRLYIFVQPVAPFELVGEVVRHTQAGFAVENIETSPEIAQLVDDVAGIVSPR